MPIDLLRRLKDEGLVGLEADHPDHAPLVRDRFHALATELGLIVTGGSDYHGDVGQSLAIGRTTEASLAALEAAAR